MTTPAAPRLPAGLPFVNEEGEVGVLSGKVELMPAASPSLAAGAAWVRRVHPLRSLWVADELRQRASYIATRRHLVPFLVSHRFEGATKPQDLARSRMGYGVGLNKAYLHEILGHIRSTPAQYTWGVLGAQAGVSVDATDLPARTAATAPRGEPAETLWWNATGDGTSWTQFFEGRVLEWMLTSPGGFILVDSTLPPPLRLVNQATASRLGLRTQVRWIPMSWVEDYGRGPNGYRWIKLAEVPDLRQPMQREDGGFTRLHVLYRLLPTGETEVSRWDDEGRLVGIPVLQRIQDEHGRGILPLIEARFGEHPDIPHLGSGLLMGLDDIVIDLFNILTELREAFRDAAFGFLSYRGPNADAARGQVSEGSRWVDIGDEPTASLERVAADGGEVAAGVQLLDLGLKNWALSAKRRALEVMEASTARSGVSLKAEFQLDLRPLLVAVAEMLDMVESQVMFVLAQLEGHTAAEARHLGVQRETEFQLEQEASRIARIVGEFLQSIPAMPAALLEKMILRWAASIDFLNLEEAAEGGGTLQEVIQQQAADIAAAEQTSRIRSLTFSDLGFGAPGGGATAGAPTTPSSTTPPRPTTP